MVTRPLAVGTFDQLRLQPKLLLRLVAEGHAKVKGIDRRGQPVFELSPLATRFVRSRVPRG